MGISKKKQDAAVASGKCYRCIEQVATVNDGIGGKICAGCAEAMRQMLLKHSIGPGYSLKKRAKHHEHI